MASHQLLRAIVFPTPRVMEGLKEIFKQHLFLLFLLVFSCFVCKLCFLLALLPSKVYLHPVFI